MEKCCEYRSKNDFCSRLTDQQASVLCEGCRLRRYEKGRYQHLDYWHRGPVLIVDGILVLGGTRDKTVDSKFKAREYMRAGNFLYVSGMLDPETHEDLYCLDESFCLSDCSLALFDKGVFDSLMGTDVDFVKKVLESCFVTWGNLEAQVCCDDAGDLVTYFLSYCHSLGYDDFTHEEIAIACNLSRPTVTKTLASLIKKNPELFS